MELTSNKTREFTCPGDHVTFTCRVFRSSALEWRNPLITQSTPYTALDTPPNILPRDPFTATLIDASGTNLNANFTSTLQVTVSKMMRRNETTVTCLSGTLKNVTDNFTITGKRSDTCRCRQTLCSAFRMSYPQAWQCVL